MRQAFRTVVQGSLIVGSALLAVTSGQNINSIPHISSPEYQKATKFTSTALLPPLYHNVTTGEAWVYPSSKYDLGARAMSCECFDPDRKNAFSC